MQLTPQLKVVITGGQGQLAQELQSLLAERVTLQVFNKSELDITHFAQVQEKLLSFAPQIIINCAAYTAVDKAQSEPERATLVNEQGSLHLAKVAEELGALLIHISTDYVFDGEKRHPYVETDAVSPLNVYGETKLAAEQQVQKHCTKHFILRTSWVFSPYGNNFVKTMLKLAQSRRELSVIDDQVGGPTFAGDLAQAIVSMCEQVDDNFHAYGLYHYGGFPYVSWFQFAQKIFQAAKDKQVVAEVPTLHAIETSGYPTPAIRPKFSWLDCKKIEDIFSIKPSNWQQALCKIEQYK